jgi:predicted DCC family thiol-disulfide oxidoreductase YuxK
MAKVISADRFSAYSYRNDPAVPAFPDDKPVFLFDGHCVFCSGWVQMLLKHDNKAQFRMLSAQTPLGCALYRHYGLDPEDHSTNMVIAGGVAYFKSQSSIYVVAALGWPWSLAKILYLLPVSWLDRAYALVARNRLRWFGRREVCMISLAGYEDRFLDGGAVPPHVTESGACHEPG